MVLPAIADRRAASDSRDPKDHQEILVQRDHWVKRDPLDRGAIPE